MDNEKNNNQPEKLDAPKKNSNKKKVFSTTLFVIGLLTLIVGVTFLLINILATLFITISTIATIFSGWIYIKGGKDLLKD